MKIELDINGDKYYFRLTNKKERYAYITIERDLKKEIQARLGSISFRKRFLERMYNRWCNIISTTT